MTPDTLLLAGLAFGFIGCLAWLEERGRRRREHHRRVVGRILGAD